MSVAELLYGVPLALPGELLDTTEPPAASFLENLQRSRSSIPTRPPPGGGSSFSSHFSGFCFVRRGAHGPPLSPLYDGLYRVVSRGPKTFTLQLGGRQKVVTVDRLKPCLAAEVTPAAPLSRGRPLKTS